MRLHYKNPMWANSTRVETEFTIGNFYYSVNRGIFCNFVVLSIPRKKLKLVLWLLCLIFYIRTMLESFLPADPIQKSSVHGFRTFNTSILLGLIT